MKNLLKWLWVSSPLLMWTATAMLAVLAVSLVGLTTDARMIGGVPAWLKPAKFGLSIAVYCVTAAWLVSLLPEWPRTTTIFEWTSALVFLVEVLLIVVQVVRGVGSHFNIATPLDAAIFSTMGVLIITQWFVSIALAFALFRQRFTDAMLGWAVRIGLVISIFGAGIGGLMTQPTPAQLAAARETQRMPQAGAHTVGAPDGGPGIAGIGWSREHGDLRVAHFLGLHAVQILPLIAFVLGRNRSTLARRRGVFVAAGSYVALTAILLAQALAGESVTAPSGPILALLAAWAGLTLVGMGAALFSHAWVSQRNLEASVAR